MESAHHVCPYSKATRGNITVTLALEDQSNGNASSGNGARGEAAGASAAA
jgi:hypothetical protein